MLKKIRFKNCRTILIQFLLTSNFGIELLPAITVSWKKKYKRFDISFRFIFFHFDFIYEYAKGFFYDKD